MSSLLLLTFLLVFLFSCCSCFISVDLSYQQPIDLLRTSPQHSSLLPSPPSPAFLSSYISCLPHPLPLPSHITAHRHRWLAADPFLSRACSTHTSSSSALPPPPPIFSQTCRSPSYAGGFGFQSQFLRILEERGFICQATAHLHQLDHMLLSTSPDDNNLPGSTPPSSGSPTVQCPSSSSPRLSAYVGVDLNHRSLHAGHLLPLLMLRWWRRCHLRPVLLLGGATTALGDPSGKDKPALKRMIERRKQMKKEPRETKQQAERAEERTTEDDRERYRLVSWSREKVVGQNIQENGRTIASVASRIVHTEDPPYLLRNSLQAVTKAPQLPTMFVVDNRKWLSALSLLDALGTVGHLVPLASLLRRHRGRTGLEEEAEGMREDGICLSEFLYSVLQSIDFAVLKKAENTVLQLGGSDQWGNIIGGIELAGRLKLGPLFGITCPLLTVSATHPNHPPLLSRPMSQSAGEEPVGPEQCTRSELLDGGQAFLGSREQVEDGRKMGKSEKGAVWLDREFMCPLDFWQFWRNTVDENVRRYLKLFTDLPLHVIDGVTEESGAALNVAKVILADEVTSLVHGPTCVQAVHACLKDGSAVEDMWAALLHHRLPESMAAQLPSQGVSVLQVLLVANLTQNEAAATAAIKDGAVRINGCRVWSSDETVKLHDFRQTPSDIANVAAEAAQARSVTDVKGETKGVVYNLVVGLGKKKQCVVQLVR
eukprot:GHVS01064383.1.p1 GENE.GHVS01064383.1~~GHVS01064383.1.p1  ORF type:complete len:711 (-),score=110.71 GHVS01064383.1:23-2155(-)